MYSLWRRVGDHCGRSGLVVDCGRQKGAPTHWTASCSYHGCRASFGDPVVRVPCRSAGCRCCANECVLSSILHVVLAIMALVSVCCLARAFRARRISQSAIPADVSQLR